MSFAGSGHNADEERPFVEPDAPPDRPQDPALLDQVLQETLALTSPDGPLSPQDRDALVDVARRHATPTVTTDAVVELIQTVLKSRFKSISENERSLTEISRDIAVTLRDDPHTWERVETFWARLCEAAK